MDKITEAVKSTTTDVKNAGTSLQENIKDTCDRIGNCVKQSGINAVNKTVTKTKETINKIPVKSIADIISKSKCVIPKDADNILRAALLQQCVSPSYGK